MLPVQISVYLTDKEVKQAYLKKSSLSVIGTKFGLDLQQKVVCECVS